MIHNATVSLHENRVSLSIKRVAARILTHHVPLKAVYAMEADGVPFSKRLSLKYRPIREGEKWGNAWDNAWFKLSGAVPKEWKGKRVVAQLDFNGEGSVFSDKGVQIQGISNGSIFDTNPGRGMQRDIFMLFERAHGGEQVNLWVEASAVGLFGSSHNPNPPRNEPIRSGHYNGSVNKIRLCALNLDLWHLWLDMETLNGVMLAQEKGSVRRARILKGLNKAIDAFADNESNTATCRAILKPLLAKKAEASALTSWAVGHAHIDTGWLWPVQHGIKKCARTFATQLDLIRKYPDYVFGASQAQHYAFVKQYYPGVYAKVKKAVAAGRWELQGGMWVESDCNITSGESLVRQFIHGKNLFMDEFGIDVRNTWIPDVFGFSAALPQIMKRAGVDFFVTQKMSWNQFTRFPYHTFVWRGIDGSEIITACPPEHTYNSQLDPQNQRTAERRFNERDTLDEFITLFGVGDGGGGPKEEQIELGLRQRDLEGVPKIHFGRADRFLDRLKKHKDELPKWVGEIYLELHRGTYTTQSRVKRGNRKLELKLRDTEYICSLARLSDYPRKELDAIWKTLLLNQFHDILPGSSIGWVYHVTERQYEESLAACNKLIEKAAGKAFKRAKNNAAIVNTLSYPYRGVIQLPAGWKGASIDGQAVPAQKEAGGTFAALSIPANSIVTLEKSDSAVASRPAKGLVLENDLIKYEFDEKGCITSAYDKECGREVLLPGARGNAISMYEDRPNNWDAWDIDIFYENVVIETGRLISSEKLASGPARKGLRFKLAFGTSEISQDIFLASDSKRLDFVTKADWKERHRMLRVRFEVDVNSDNASFDIQYGYATRPTHRNTEHDVARFESIGQRYADLSGGGYGVALLNDCKYGYNVHGNIMDLALLRSPTHPHGDADQGKHEFTYSFLPHAGMLIDSDVIPEAARLNCPPLCLTGYAAGNAVVPCRIEGEGVSMEVLKKAEKEESLVIRLVETRGMTTKVRVITENESLVLRETNLLEWTNEGTVRDGVIEMKPFEIRTFKLQAGRKR